MWNHSSKSGNSVATFSTTSGDGGGGGDMLSEKLEKSLSLENYLNFLQSLFSQSTSDSDGSDTEGGGCLSLKPFVSQIDVNCSSPDVDKNKFLSSVAAQSTVENSQKAVGGQVESSTSSSSFSSDHDSLIPSLPPISDLDLNNLLKKPTNYLGDSQGEAAPKTDSSSDKKPQKKKKKKTPKKKADDENQRQNKPNSGGKGNGSRGGGLSGNGSSGGGSGSNDNSYSTLNNSGGSSKSGQNNSGSGGGSSGNSRTRKLNDDPADGTDDVVNKLRIKRIKLGSNSVTSKSLKVSSASMSPNNLASAKNSKIHKIRATSTDTNYGQSGGSPVAVASTFNSYDFNNHDDENDNDSLSDYMSMAATAQVPSFHSSNSDERFFNLGHFDHDNKNSGENGPSSILSSGESSKHSSAASDSNTSEGLKRKRRRSSGEYDEAVAKMIEMFNAKRKTIFVYLAKKEIPRAQRNRVNSHKDMLAIRRRLAQSCVKAVRQKALQSQRTMKDSTWRAKRLTREMQAYWKQANRVERENKKRKDKEAEEQRKQDMELLETKRQQRRLNFLITQAELYSHCSLKELKNENEPHQNNWSDDIEEVILERLKEDHQFDEHDTNEMKKRARTNVEIALKEQNPQNKPENGRIVTAKSEFSQPEIFLGNLKRYQLQGMNWLINLYNQGINGILADEIGLGKNVQAISFLAHIAEKCGVWGPFLLISPSQSLHNWQQDLSRLVPSFKLVPYWGNPQERKILRQFWDQHNVHKQEASFHIVITSLNLLVQDIKYFNKVNWQYLILDEPQAIRATATNTKLKVLLGFDCQNRLLLSENSLSNNTGELWTILHFIMPSLFDSQEFSEWFTKDDSHDNKSQIDERYLPRLMSILKSFLLRRIKKDVEKELIEKTEVILPCPLTSRQRFLYSALKRKILPEELLKLSQNPQNNSRNLINLIMQFRKVCNHPDLLERRDVKSPFFMQKILQSYPPLIFNETLLHNSLNKFRILGNQFSIFNPINIHFSLFPNNNLTSRQHKISENTRKGKKIDDIHLASVQEKGLSNSQTEECAWSFLRFSGLSPGDISNLACDGILGRIKHLVNTRNKFEESLHYEIWNEDVPNLSNLLLIIPDKKKNILQNSQHHLTSLLPKLAFTSHTGIFYKWKDGIFPKSKSFLIKEGPIIQKDSVISNEQQKPRIEELSHLHAELMPKFLFNFPLKVLSEGIRPYFYEKGAQFWTERLEKCSNPENELNNCILYGTPVKPFRKFFVSEEEGGLMGINSIHGWSRIVVPDKDKLITDSGKLLVLDGLLKQLKATGHRVIIYSQMFKMIDILEEFLTYRKWTYLRFDGSSKNPSVAELDNDNIFVFLLSTRLGGGDVGVNLTSADTVIFFDNDINPSIDQLAMDKVNGLGQTKPVTIFRLICKGTVEERIFLRMKEKSLIKEIPSEQLGKVNGLTPKEFLSFLFDDEEQERKYRQRHTEKKLAAQQDKTSPKKSSSILLEKSTNAHEDKEISTEEPKSYLNEEYGKMLDTTASSSGSIEGSLPSDDSAVDSDLKEIDLPDASEYDDDFLEINPSTSSYFEDYSTTMDWNSGSVSDYDEDLQFIPKKPNKLGRGTGKRGRPPSRIRVIRDLSSGCNDQFRRGPGRPRLKPIGPSNQGIRGRRPGRPPLSKKAETISSSLTPLTQSQRVFGIYSSPDLDLS